MVPNNIICPHCKKSDIVKRGTFQTKAHGKQQRYFCKNCNKKFIPHTAFYRMRNTPQKITLCLDLFYRGISTRKVQEHLQTFYPHNSDHSTILRWIWRYAKLISTFTNKLKLNVGKEVQVDEVEYKRRLFHTKGGKGAEKNWFIDSIDPKTKFMLGSEYAKSRDSANIKTVVNRIKERTDKQIEMVTTDGLNAYDSVVKSVFGYNNKLGRYNVYHKKVIVSESDSVFNYPIERLHNNIRHRTKTFRGFHGSIQSANLILKGYETYYNFITKHQTINCCPYELACPDLKLTSKNKWLELIERSFS
ncbi:MAG: hypothetical protein RL557_752 [archaeon]